jgi:NitT/TauT family transport system permease protein
MKYKSLITVGIAAIIWEVGVRLFEIPKYLLPPISAILVRFVAERQELFEQTIPTLIEIVSGYLIALVVGFLLAVLIAYSRTMEETIFPILVSFQVIPKVALAPLFLVWLGFGLAPKITVSALIAFFPIVVNTAKGLRSVEQELIQWFKSMGATPWEIFYKLSLPTALPYLLAAMKVSIGLATVGAVTGEFIGTNAGLGYIILRSTVNLDTTYLFCGIIAVSILGVVLYGLIVALERYLLSWQIAVEAPPETL